MLKFKAERIALKVIFGKIKKIPEAVVYASDKKGNSETLKYQLLT